MEKSRNIFNVFNELDYPYLAKLLILLIFLLYYSKTIKVVDLGVG